MAIHLENEINSFRLSSDHREKLLVSGRGRAQRFSAMLRRELRERAQPAGSPQPCQGPPSWAMDIAKGFYSSLPQSSYLIKTVHSLFFIRTSPEPLAVRAALPRASQVKVPLCPSGLGLVKRDKDRPLCHPHTCGFTWNLLCARPLFQSHSSLSCQPGPGAVVYFMLFHVFPSLAVILLWGDFPHWLAPLSHLEPWEHVFYPLACACAWLGTHFQNGLESQQIAHTINCRETCVGKQPVQAIEWPPLASVCAPHTFPPYACQHYSSVAHIW